jgi:hypothetical protein
MSSTSPAASYPAVEGACAVPSPADDRVLYWPMAISVFWPAGLVLVSYGPSDLEVFGAPLLVLLWGISAFYFLVLAIACAIERAWRLLLSVLVLPLTTLIAFLNLGLVWRTASWAGLELHLSIMRPFYLHELSNIPTGEPRLMFFKWWGGITHTDGLVYDEGDEIASGHRSQAWQKKAAQAGFPCDALYAPLGNHFYYITMRC